MTGRAAFPLTQLIQCFSDERVPRARRRLPMGNADPPDHDHQINMFAGPVPSEKSSSRPVAPVGRWRGSGGANYCAEASQAPVPGGKRHAFDIGSDPRHGADVSFVMGRFGSSSKGRLAKPFLPVRASTQPCNPSTSTHGGYSTQSPASPASRPNGRAPNCSLPRVISPRPSNPTMVRSP